MAGTLSITTPATDSQAGYSTSSITIVWSFTGTAGAVQTQRRVWMYPVGSPGMIVYDTGMGAFTDTSAAVTGFSTGVSYSVNVSVVDTAGATTTASRIVVSNYTRPLPPTLSFAPGESGVAVIVANPTGGSRPAVTVNSIYRRVAGSGSAWTFLGNTGNNGTFGDFTSAAGVTYEYFARANGQVDSVIGTTTAAAMMGAWVHDVGSAPIATLQHFIYANGASESLGIEESVLQFVGRTYPVVESGDAETTTLSISIELPPWDRVAGEAWWQARKRARAVLLYRDGRGRAQVSSIVGPVSTSPSSAGSVLTCTLQRVDHADSLLPASSYNYLSTSDGGYGVGGYGTTGYGA